MSDQRKEKIPSETPVKQDPHKDVPDTDPGIGPGEDQPCEDVPKPLQD